MSSTAASSSISPASQARAGSAKIVRPTAKPRTSGTPVAARKALHQLLLRRIEAEQHDAAAPGVVFLDDGADRSPCFGGGLRLELPPVGLDAEIVKLGQRPRHRIAVERAMLAGDDLDEQLAAEAAGGVVEAAERPPLLRLQRRVVVGMVEGEALDRVRHRPFDRGASRCLRRLRSGAGASPAPRRGGRSTADAFDASKRASRP